MNATRYLDLCGLQCPHVAVLTKRALATMAPGETIEVKTDDELAPIDLELMVTELGHRLVRVVENGCSFDVLIAAGAQRPDAASHWPIID